MNFSRKMKIRVINGYLEEVGKTKFVPEEFINWLEHKPDHEMYDAFFGEDDSVAAHKWRVHQATRMVTGLRIVHSVEPATVKELKIETSKEPRQYPAFISPMADRPSGGGFYMMDPDDDTVQAELRRQAANQLTNWLTRYRGCAEHFGIDLSGVDQVALILSGEESKELSA